MNANALSGTSFPAQDQLLLSVLKDVLARWAFLSAESMGRPSERAGILALEMRLTFFGEREGRLVLRTSTKLGKRLVQIAMGEPDADDEAAKDALGELCNLVGKHLATRTFSGEGARIQSSVPESSTPLDWPSVAPTQSVALRIEGEILEARVWMWQPAKIREPHL